MNGDLMIEDDLAVATRDVTDVAVRATSLIETGTVNVKETGTEGIVTVTTTDTVIVTGKETTRETVVDAGVKMRVRNQKIVPRGDVARRVRMRFPLLGTAHAGVLRELIPGIVLVLVTNVPGILAIPETNSMTHPSTGGTVGHAAPAMKMTHTDASHLRLLQRMLSIICPIGPAVRS